MTIFVPQVTATGTAASYLANGLYQIAYVVPDLDAAVETYEQTLGSNRFMVLRKAAVQNQTYRGQPSDVTQDIAFGYAGNMQIELIQPLTGPSTYTELLEARPMGGLHHVGAWVEDFFAAAKALEGAGHPMLQYGEFAESTHFAYFDTTASLGSLLEIFNWDEQTTAMFDSIRLGTLTSNA